jgi:Cu2+-exporting ATPase
MDHSHDHSHHRKDKVQNNGRGTADHLKEKTLHAHENAVPEKEKIGHKPKPEHGGHHGGGHEDHHRMMIEDFKRRFWIFLILAVPVILLSLMVQHILGFELVVPYAGFIAFGISSIIYFYGGWPFFKGLVEEVRKGSPCMMTPIGVAITVAYVFYSTAVVFGLEGMDFFWELATLLIVVMLLVSGVQIACQSPNA